MVEVLVLVQIFDEALVVLLLEQTLDGVLTVLVLVQTLDEALAILVLVQVLTDSLDSVWYLCSISGVMEGQLPDSWRISR
jgi:hypothetical protein